MRLKILLINPWIYDFAAYNLWAKPLGLLKVAEYLSSFDVELSLIDCMEDFEVKRYGTGHYRFDEVSKPAILNGIRRKFKRYGIRPDVFRELLRQSGPIDFVVMTSVMAYWYPGIQEAIGIIREEVGDVPIILGGIYATIYHKHASDYSDADFIYRGPVNNSLKFAISTFGFRIKEKYAARPYYEMLLFSNTHCAPLLTSTGCPFQCSYCASKILADFSQRESSAILSEIKDLNDRGIRDFAFYDDALLVNRDTHLIPLLREVINEGLHVRFHTPNGLHARFVDRELAGLMRRSGFTTLRLSLETVNEKRQMALGGKVCIEELQRAVEVLWEAGFTKREVGVYIMYGLPGQELEEVKESICFLKRLGVGINLTEFAPIKGTKSWEELKCRGIISEDLDPLLTNNSIFPLLFSGYNPEVVEKMKIGCEGL